MNEPELQPNDLEERLKTTRNRCDIALLLIRFNANSLLPTVLEDLFSGTQCILDLYCCVDKNEQTDSNT